MQKTLTKLCALCVQWLARRAESKRKRQLMDAFMATVESRPDYERSIVNYDRKMDDLIERYRIQ